jgi:mono/diheme cytochrome c family protein
MNKKHVGSFGTFFAAISAVSLFIISVSSASAETLLERGTYLMQGVVACGNCHTAPGGPMADKELAGGLKWDEPPFTTYATNITPDRETGIGAWSDEEILRSFREGIRPDGGRIVGPPMPIEFYRSFSDRDAKAIVAYLRQVEPVRNKMPEAEYRMPLPPNYGPPISSVPEVPRDDKVAYGKYLSDIGHCMECHTPFGERGRDYANQLGAGGYEFKGPWGVSVASNLTPTGLKDRTDAEIKQMISTGTRPDGSKMLPPMAYRYYANISDEDLDALVAYLRSLPAK